MKSLFNPQGLIILILFSILRGYFVSLNTLQSIHLCIACPFLHNSIQKLKSYILWFNGKTGKWIKRWIEWYKLSPLSIESVNENNLQPGLNKISVQNSMFTYISIISLLTVYNRHLKAEGYNDQNVTITTNIDILIWIKAYNNYIK